MATEQTLEVLTTTLDRVAALGAQTLVGRCGRWPDELSGVERPVIWTVERDQEVWAQMQS